MNFLIKIDNFYRLNFIVFRGFFSRYMVLNVMFFLDCNKVEGLEVIKRNIGSFGGEEIICY